jgi:hypothetical protein
MSILSYKRCDTRTTNGIYHILEFKKRIIDYNNNKNSFYQFI